MSFLPSFRLHSSYFPPVPLAVPYWNGAAYRNILGCLVSGKIIEGHDLEELEQMLLGILSGGAVVLCGSGSLGLEIALRGLGVGPGDEVVIPTFCCTAVVAPILAAGGRPVLADVGEELNITAETAETVFSGKTKAIIVPHLFGNPAEIGPIIDLARANNVRVIDDAAQALGAAIDGQPLGSLGDAGIVSFAREKICSGLGGGAVVFKDRELAARLGNVRLSAPARVTELGNLLSILVWHRWRRWSWPLRGLLSAAAQHNPAAPPSFYRSEAMANLKAAVAYSLMQVLQENIRARRGRVEAYRALLGADERLQLIAHGDGSACLTQIVRVLPPRSGEDLAFQAIEALGDAGYEVQGSYVPIHLLPGYERCQRNRLPRAERVWSDLIELPCEPEVELIHVERIAAILKKVLDR